MAIATVLSTLAPHAAEHTLASLALSVIAAPVIYIIINEFIRYNARIGSLKGPRGLPLVGNLWDIRVNAAQKYRAWAREYGAVYQIQLGNIPVVVVNSAAAAKVLFGQNAQALSSRPELYTFHKVFIANSVIAWSGYGTDISYRFSQTLRAPRSAPLHTANLLNVVARAQLLLLISRLSKHTSHTWILKAVILSGSCTHMVMLARRRQTQCP